MMQRIFAMDATTIILSLTIVAVPLQLLLCRVAKNIWIKLIPIALLTLVAITFSICSHYASGWDAIGYFGLALLSIGLILVCGVSWFFCAVFGKSKC